MSNLQPEVRTDKNGHLVTRHVKQGEPVALRVVANAKPKSAAKKASRIATDPSYDVAKESFIDKNPEDEILFDEFFLGSSKEDSIDHLELVLSKNPELTEDDIIYGGLSNGHIGYWVNEEHLNLPIDEQVYIQSHSYEDALDELKGLQDTEYGSQFIDRTRHSLEVYAAYHALNGGEPVSEIVPIAESKYYGKFRGADELGEFMFEQEYGDIDDDGSGLDSRSGMQAIGDYIDWDKAATNYTQSEIGLGGGLEDDTETPDGGEVRAYLDYQESYKGLGSYVDWVAYAGGSAGGYDSIKGYYFKR